MMVRVQPRIHPRLARLPSQARLPSLARLPFLAPQRLKHPQQPVLAAAIRYPSTPLRARGYGGGGD